MTLLPDVSPELVAQAPDAKMLFGREILQKASRNCGRYLLLTMPDMVIFFFSQRIFTQGIVMTGVKG